MVKLYSKVKKVRYVSASLHTSCAQLVHGDTIGTLASVGDSNLFISDLNPVLEFILNLDDKKTNTAVSFTKILH
jgi:hypothetical protein